MHDDALGLNVIGHAGYVFRKAIAAQMLLPYQEKVDAVTFGLLAYFTGLFHVGGIARSVHAEPVENLFGFIDQFFSFAQRHKLGQIGFSQFIYVVQLAIRKQAGPSNPAQNVTGLAFDAFFIRFDRAIAFLGDIAFSMSSHLFVGMLAQIIGRK